jgi:transcriptional regulator GlxA family with amidase domain
VADDARPGLVRRLNRLTHFAGEHHQEFALLASAADLLDYLGHSAGALHSRDGTTGTLPSREVSSAIALMEADTSHPWSIDEIAQAVSMSASQLSRLFRRDLGTSPAAYLSRARVDRMAELLSTTRIAIASAAQSSGWTNPAVATRAFKRRFGVTPSAFASAYRHERTPMIGAS